MPPKKKFKLTAKNYFSPDRPHVSTSMIKDYFRSPAYYKRKYIDKDPALKFKVTDPMKRGSVVDEILTGGSVGKYTKKVYKKDDPKEYARQQKLDDRFVVGATYWDQAMQIAEDLEKHPVWGKPKKATYQVVLNGEIEGLQVCGLADRVDIPKKGKIKLIDLKVVNPIKLDSPRKWLWNCKEMKYTHQLAMYQHLLAEMTKVSIDDIECCHVVAAYEDVGLTKVRAYKFSQDLLDEAFNELTQACKDIKELKFDQSFTEWKDAVELR